MRRRSGLGRSFYSHPMCPHMSRSPFFLYDVCMFSCEMTCALEARGVVGRGIVAFDAQWALEYISTEPIDFPLLLPDATAKLGLTGVAEASATLQDLSRRFEKKRSRKRGGGGEAAARQSLIAMLGATLEADSHRPVAEQWGAQGRLVGEYLSGELAQVQLIKRSRHKYLMRTRVANLYFSTQTPISPICHTPFSPHFRI